MNITIRRDRPDGVATLGTLWLEGQADRECFTLEPSPPVVPAGTYPWRKGWSNRLQAIVPRISVPGHGDLMLIHWGNWAKNTEGCTLVGTTEGKDFVGHSREEFAALMAKLPDAGMICYEDTHDD
jgi:hypothetical protein